MRLTGRRNESLGEEGWGTSHFLQGEHRAVAKRMSLMRMNERIDYLLFVLSCSPGVVGVIRTGTVFIASGGVVGVEKVAKGCISTELGGR